MTNRTVIPDPCKLKCFSHDRLTQLDPLRIPKHIAIIPDGNRRWAQKRLENIYKGHEAGADTLIEIVNAAKELQVETVTFYGFSTENQNRSGVEIAALMRLIHLYLSEQCEKMIQEGIQLKTIGNIAGLPPFLRETFHETCMSTRHCQGITLVLAMNYGSRNEICRAFSAMLNDYENNRLKKEEIDEATVSRYLDTHPWSDPELCIRTSGELRVSNFLLWQIAYSEIHISPVLWPDFTPEDLFRAVLDYQTRQRRWGT